MPGFRSLEGMGAVEALLPQYVARFPRKFAWFAAKGYRPHAWQILFHGAHNDSAELYRMRHLAAGRRGGKTLSAAWEVLFYALHPADFHRDAHGVESDEPLWIWILSKSYKTVRPSLLTFLSVMRKAGLVKGRDYEYNKTERIIEFPDGTLIEFKTAEDPENLRGPGLDILWIDEAAYLSDAEAWWTIRPALADKLGRLITTTTPKGKNWLYEEFWVKLAYRADQFRIEYTSLDNPHFPREEWEDALETYHPLLFRQEYMAAFDAMAGVALSGEWLHYYVLGLGTALGDPDDVKLDPKVELRKYLAIDPATGEGQDDFAMALVGVPESREYAYVLKTFKGKIPFPEQIELIQDWHRTYRPEYIGVEAYAFQRVMVQQLSRLPGMPNVLPVFTGSGIGKDAKKKRILAMSPLFKTGRVRIHRSMRDLIDQWISYDPDESKPKDDLLDAVEIALGLAGVLLPRQELAEYRDPYDEPVTLDDLVKRDQRMYGDPTANFYDPDLGAEFF